MREERIKILEMLKEGVITVEESIKLMDTIESQKEQEEAREAREERKEREDSSGGSEPNFTIWSTDGSKRKRQGVFDQISEMVETITENVTKGVSDTFEQFEVGEFTKGSKFSFSDSPENLESIQLKGKNGPIKVESHDGNTVELHGKYNPRPGRKPSFEVTYNEGRMELDYDYNAVRSLSLKLLIPNTLIKELDLQTSNGRIEFEDIKSSTIYAKSSNGSIVVEDTESDLLVLGTSNSSIVLDDVKVTKAKLSTSNSSIKLEDVFATEIEARTSNSSISIKDLEPLENDVTVEAQTVNSGINVELEGVAAKFRAGTSIGRVMTQGRFVYIENSKSFVKAETPNYDEAEKRVNLSLDTANANIKISVDE
ncbi:MAG: DUF4097 domain-containing protein [Defluviitaleaceae bacterium]|nr:DUF4097 domain-containing protein [Defluviitaleaceae bacterium]